MSEETPKVVADPKQPAWLFWGTFSVISVGWLIYSQTMSFSWDEGFHLLAAQLIARGKRPYLDFFFAQVPLNAYWNALWMRVFAESWHVAHVMAALMSLGGLILIAGFFQSRPHIGTWRFQATLAVVLMVGLNMTVMEFGTIGQPYGFCFFFVAAAFRLAVKSARPGAWRPALAAGFCVACAACGSLLTAPIGPVLLLWILIFNQAGKRLIKLAAFLGGMLPPFFPVIWAFIQSPSQTLFGVFKYHFFYREVEWDGALSHNLELLTSWINSSRVLMLVLLGIWGLWYVIKHAGWERLERAEIYLCAALAIVQAGYLSTIRPTFPQYFLLAVPFLGLLASLGYCFAISRLNPSGGLWQSLGVLALLLLLMLSREIYDDRNDLNWYDFEKVAAKVAQVTPPGKAFLADEHVYFLTRRLPPPGMEYEDSHKLKLPVDLLAQMHIVGRAQLDGWIKSGLFSSIETDEEEKLEELGVSKLYKQKEKVVDSTIYWELANPAQAHPAKPR
jgi:hypothetical protein